MPDKCPLTDSSFFQCENCEFCNVYGSFSFCEYPIIQNKKKIEIKYYDKSPNTRGIRNNNPFNIVKSSNKWFGKVTPSPDEKFETFDNIELGVRAGVILISNYIRKIRDSCTGKPINNISTIINRFAPSHENTSEEYVYFIVRNMAYIYPDFDRNTTIYYPSDEFCSLCCLILIYESQYYVPIKHIYYIINKYQLY